MATRNPAPRKKASPAAKKMSTADMLRAHGVLLEDLRSQMQFVLETVTGQYQALHQKIDDVERRLLERIEILESVVRQNSADIQKNSADIERLRHEVGRLRQDFDNREDKARSAALEERVRRVEVKLGIVS